MAKMSPLRQGWRWGQKSRHVHRAYVPLPHPCDKRHQPNALHTINDVTNGLADQSYLLAPMEGLQKNCHSIAPDLALATSTAKGALQ